MSDTMLFGVLKMPFEMAMRDEISRIQFYQRVQELVARVEAQPEQEPVAVKHMMEWVELLKRQSDYGQHMCIPGLNAGVCFSLGVELEQFINTTPPQRPWVELTASTILNLMPSSIPADHDGALMDFARSIEAKLKERNT
jgi:hypothetical protein